MRTTNKLPLNTQLLAALIALVEERSVSLAASREAVSQPSMSRLLNRLRELTGDPILQRIGNSQRPTERAIALAREASDVLARTASLLSEKPYDPVQDSGLVRIAASDYGEAMILSPVVAEISRRAPGLSVQIVGWDADTIEDLRRGRLDFALGVADEAPEPLVAVKLFRERLVGLARVQHPALRRKMSLKVYSSYGHIVVSTGSGSVVAVDPWLRRAGLKRRVVYRTRHFLGAARMASQSDLLTAAPRRFAMWLESICQVKTFKLPFESPTFDYVLLAAEPLDRQGRQKWLAELIASAARTLGDS